MRSPVREHLGEALTGLLVIIIAIAFAWFAWLRTGGGTITGATEIAALFPNTTGIEVGTDVRIAGLKVGSVTKQELDPQTFQVKATLAIDPKIKVPVDSSAAVTSEGILGGSYVALIPGGDKTPLKTGDMITDTQGAVDMMGLVGQFINKSGGESSGEAASGNSSAP